MAGFDVRLMQRTNGIQYLRTGDFLDSLVEDGRLFGTSPLLTLTASPNKYLTFTTGPGVNTHIYIGFISTAETIVNTYLEPTITSPGTLAGIANFNLTKSNVSGAQVRLDPTFSATGFKIADFLIPGGSGGNAVGGALQTGSKVILPPSTTFLFEADGTTNSFLEVSFLFYEEVIGAF